MLKIDNAIKDYGKFRLQCSMEVKPGMITGLIGENGAGKSTTFKAILDLISLDGGKITIFDKHSTELTKEDKQKIGVVLSDSGFSEYLTVQDVAKILKAMYPQFNEKEFWEKCKFFSIPTKQKLKEFSTGMRAKLRMVAAMSHGAEFLLLDEPTAGLDVVARDGLLEMLQDYLNEEENRSVLISSHIASDLEKLCDDIYMIHQGNIILHESTDVLLNEYGVIKADQSTGDALDKSHLLVRKQEAFGLMYLTNDRQYYQERYPRLVVEKCGIDDVILMMTKGERL